MFCALLTLASVLDVFLAKWSKLWMKTSWNRHADMRARDNVRSLSSAESSGDNWGISFFLRFYFRLKLEADALHLCYLSPKRIPHFRPHIFAKKLQLLYPPRQLLVQVLCRKPAICVQFNIILWRFYINFTKTTWNHKSETKCSYFNSEHNSVSIYSIIR